jgi:hypothetical protein
MDRRAEEIEHQADSAIYSDDHDAIDRLREKLSGLEASRDRMKACNVAIRKHGLERLMQPDPPFQLTEAEIKDLLSVVQHQAYYHAEKRGYPPYALNNLGGTITRTRQRLAALEADKTPVRGSVAVLQPQGETATARAGLTVTAAMTTPAKAWKKPRPVWNVSGNLAFWRPLLVDNLGGSWYRGVVSFWEDPTEEIETACLECEAEDRIRTAEGLPTIGGQA